MKSLRLTFLLSRVLICLSLAVTAASAAGGGSVLVFPFYTSGAIPATHDTTMTIMNLDAGAGKAVHLMFVDGRASGSGSCEQLDFYACIDAGGSYTIKASDIDPMLACGYLLAVIVDAATGNPIMDNSLTGSATVTMPAGTLHSTAGPVSGMYTAECFKALTAPNPVGWPAGKATLDFNGIVYEQVGKWLTTPIQPPSVLGQTIITVGLNGDLDASTQNGAAQSAVGVIYNSKGKLASFSNLLTGKCQAKSTLTPTIPRVAYTLQGFLNNLPGTLKVPVGGGVGLLVTPPGGITNLNKMTLCPAKLDIPRFNMPVCINTP